MNQPTAAQTPAATTPAGAMLRTLTLVAGLSGFLVVLAFQLTEPLIEENKRIAIERALFKVIPGAVNRRDFMLTGTTLNPAANGKPGEGIRIYAGYDDQDRLAGIALEAAAQGYQDVIRILYSYEPACECIRGIEVLKMAETPGIGDKIAKDPGFLRNFEALDARLDTTGSGLAQAIVSVKHGSKTEPWQIDAISGATISSKAVARMLNDTAQRILPQITRHLEQLHGSHGGAQ
jgi:electron transport complex protein RnfG